MDTMEMLKQISDTLKQIENKLGTEEKDIDISSKLTREEKQILFLKRLFND